MKKPEKIRVFCDFDGTISQPDVGATIFNHFASGDNLGTVKLWMEQKITTVECMWRECNYMRASKEEIITELEKIKLRSGFRRFLKLLDDHEVPIHIISDGLDFYIKAFLEKEHISGIDIHASGSLFIGNRLYPLFPYYHLGCGSCGTCKGERIRTISRQGEFRIMLGDGYSDRCSIGEADLIFARADLAKLCEEKSVDYIPFEDFLAVVSYFEKHLL